MKALPHGENCCTIYFMDLNGKKLLIVDDEPDLREMISFEFDLLGVDISEASSGNEAIKFLESNGDDIDAIISDIRMPDGDGLSLLKFVSKKSNRCPFLFISGFADLSAEEAFYQGAQSIWSKPFDLQDLVDEVVFYLQSWQERLAQKPLTSKNIAINISTYEQAKMSGEFGLSACGIYFFTDQKLSFEDQFNFEVSTSDDLTLSGIAKVKWIEKSDSSTNSVSVGAEFSWLAPDSMEFIKSNYDTDRFNSPFIPSPKKF